LINSTEQFGKLLSETLNSDIEESIKTKENIGELLFVTLRVIYCYHDVVVKAQLISNNSVQAGELFEFPTKNDDLTNFTHGHASIKFSNTLLRGVLAQLPPSECLQYLVLYF